MLLILVRRILFTSVDVLAAAVPLVPVMIVLNFIRFRNGRRTAAYILFGLYLAAVAALVGLPSVVYVRFGPNLNLVPFRDLAADLGNCCMNMALFVPLGIFLPCLWRKYRSLGATAFHGLCLSLTIEVMQIFVSRASDVNDLIFNTAGTAVGCFLGKWLVKTLRISGRTDRDLPWVYGAVFGVMFFLQPFVSNFFWDFLLEQGIF
ncbi:MAG: VanZ family protein [Eubacteriales bacterium]|nr:VanZ family protein [Eubacteriales bacterium]